MKVEYAHQSPEKLLNNCTLMGLLARGFVYPDQTFQAALTQGRYGQELEEALLAGDHAPATERAALSLRGAMQGEQLSSHHLEGEYTYLFARKVACPPNETSYGADKTFNRVHELSDIASFYAAFGFKVSDSNAELPDHIGAQLEFLAVLYGKEAYAFERNLHQQAELCCGARERFLTDHLGKWVPLFVRKLEETGRIRFYPALAAMVHSLLSEEPAYTQAEQLV